MTRERSFAVAGREASLRSGKVQQLVAYLSLFSAGFIASYVFGEPAVRRLERSRPAARLRDAARSLTRRPR